jgi:hypothetical protein
LGTFGLALLVMSLVMFLKIRRLTRKAEQARSSWLSVPAKMVYSRVEKTTQSGGTGPSATVYSARFRYEYSLGGKQYEGSKYSLVGDWSSSDPQPHQKEQSEFPEGGDVKVWVNPLDPSESVLRLDRSAFPDMTLMYFFTIFFGTGLVGAAVVIALAKKS